MWFPKLVQTKYSEKCQITFLTKQCKKMEDKYGIPMVGSLYCKDKCPYYKGEFNFGKIEFIKCSNIL